MAGRSRFDAPNWMLSAVEKIPGNPWESFNPDDARYLHGKQFEWLPAEADPEASMIFFLRKKALVLAAGFFSIQTVQKQSGGQPAAAYLYQDKAHVRLVPDGFGYIPPKDEKIRYGVSMGEGRNNFHALMGLWVSAERTLVVPSDTEIIDEHVHRKTELGKRYPNVPHI